MAYTSSDIASAVDILTGYKDQLALLVSLLALTASIITSRQNIRTVERVARETTDSNRQLARNTTYQRIHEQLVDPKAAAGRRRLFQSAAAGRYPTVGEEGWDEINYALALYDTLSGYVARDQIDEAVVLEAWHHPLTNIAGATRAFIVHRQNQNIQQPWAHLVFLLEKAESYECRCPVQAGSAADSNRPATGD